jgi:hypothetical protein
MQLDDDTLDDVPARTPVLRWWPAIAALVGVAGMVAAGSLAGFVIAAMLVVCGLALELGGWAELMRTHGRRLAAAAVCGALVGAAIVAVGHVRGLDTKAPDRIALGR